MDHDVVGPKSYSVEPGVEVARILLDNGVSLDQRNDQGLNWWEALASNLGAEYRPRIEALRAAIEPMQ